MLLDFRQLWNSTIDFGESIPKKREYLYASEIGGSIIDTYLKLRETEYTNPPNSRAYRKFKAGDIWEDIVRQVLLKAGIQFKTQERIEVNYEGMLPIHGKIDFIIFGEVGEIKLDGSELEITKKLTEGIHNQFKGTIIEEQILEIKSVGSFVFEDLEKNDKPKTNHLLQAYCYHKATTLPASVVYVCRDDCRILQYDVKQNATELEKDLFSWVEKISYFHFKNELPPLEPKIIIEGGKLKKNWRVEYSNYLSKLYKYETPDQFFEEVSKEVSGANRVISRIKNGDKMTDSNNEYIELFKSKYLIDLTKI